VRLDPGDRLLLFAEGITEASLPDGDESGAGRLLQCGWRSAKNSTAELTAPLLNDVKRFCASQLQDDARLIAISAWAPAADANGDQPLLAGTEMR
jgi:serine phosphatase RsbU (regulator of sigma subunit)